MEVTYNKDIMSVKLNDGTYREYVKIIKPKETFQANLIKYNLKDVVLKCIENNAFAHRIYDNVLEITELRGFGDDNNISYKCKLLFKEIFEMPDIHMTEMPENVKKYICVLHNKLNYLENTIERLNVDIESMC